MSVGFSLRVISTDFQKDNLETSMYYVVKIEMVSYSLSNRFEGVEYYVRKLSFTSEDQTKVYTANYALLFLFATSLATNLSKWLTHIIEALLNLDIESSSHVDFQFSFL